jgi:hypothetical protein
MNAIVVYESLWGNTAAVASAIAKGIGGGTRAFSTAEATPEVLSGAELIVAGSPLLGFALPTEGMRKSVGTNPANLSAPPDLTHPSMRSWLEKLPRGTGRSASFETRIWWSPGSASKTILGLLEGAGYSPVAKAQRFIVTGKYGPLRDGELERARAWGAELARSGGQ